MCGKTISFAAYPELEETFEDFQLALVHTGFFTADYVEANRPPEWRKQQAALAGTWALTTLRLGNPFVDWKKLSR